MSDVAYPTVLSLFSGVGGLELGIRLAVPGARVLGYVERDAYAASVLLARMEDSSLEFAPIWIGEIEDLDGSELADRVDIICGGFPCQDISVAGQGEGIGGRRSGLWSEIVRLADEIRPRFLFLENVSAITSRGLDTVLADLAEGGFDAEWLCLRASDVGAPHRRERWFCLAYRGRSMSSRTGSDTQPQDTINAARACGAAVAHAANERRERAGAAWRGRGGSEDDVGDGAVERAGGVFPPGPADHDAWRAVLEHSPHLAPAVESGVRVLADAEPINFAAAEMQSYLSRQRSHLWSLCREDNRR
jgi:DNA (cytosine-5)-methyltransferase 1